ncbi:hypothetical protein D3C81_935800 [compost metagenome]
MRDDQKPIQWLGSSKDDLRRFPPVARQRGGYQLDLIQDGEEPTDLKPMESVGQGVREIRIKCKDGAFRVIYVVSRPFRKATEKTEKRDIDVARARFRSLLGTASVQSDSI